MGGCEVREKLVKWNETTIEREYRRIHAHAMGCEVKEYAKLIEQKKYYSLLVIDIYSTGDGDSEAMEAIHTWLMENILGGWFYAGFEWKGVEEGYDSYDLKISFDDYLDLVKFKLTWSDEYEIG
jgi:hypothetical protein